MQPAYVPSLQQQNSAATPHAAVAMPKKERNQPGNPNPDVEVIALSPRMLLREHNLQLHRRGHDLPWKLLKNPKENRGKVYLCPEPTFMHHDSSRALGDLMGMKKRYCRKHGEKQ
ncbi:hypothetical protein EJB05_43932 [Eragrostis curvula]|uniref:BIRD-IDD transcription factor second C2H2 zinc finger domain-containing protein n=1 Tax=Eragrostis curvula TaxID=38414 RepID=A0A5J9TG74_9POAL|nr:hypothetical protein EJB05_43932 [Eragrostis curvula]